MSVKNRKTWLALAVVSGVALTGCFHESDDDHDHGDATLGITSDNAKLAAAYAIDFMNPDIGYGISGYNSAIGSNLDLTGLTAVNKVYTMTENCGVSGTEVSTFTDNDESESWTAGDVFRSTQSDCVEEVGDDPDNSFDQIALDSADGTTTVITYTGGRGTTTFGSVTITETASMFDVMINGNFVETDTETEGGVTTTTTTTFSGSMSIDKTNGKLTGFGSVSDSEMGGSVLVSIADATAVMFSIDMNGDVIYSGGQWDITGDHSGMTLTADANGTDASISVDTDGDGTDDVSAINTTWSELDDYYECGTSPCP